MHIFNSMCIFCKLQSAHGIGLKKSRDTCFNTDNEVHFQPFLVNRKSNTAQSQSEQVTSGSMSMFLTRWQRRRTLEFIINYNIKLSSLFFFRGSYCYQRSSICFLIIDLFEEHRHILAKPYGIVEGTSQSMPEHKTAFSISPQCSFG